MAVYIEILILAVSSNIDDLGTGLALSIKGYHPTLRFRVTVAFFSGATMLLGMLLGRQAVAWLSPRVVSITGALVFLLCALWFLVEGCQKRYTCQEKQAPAGHHPAEAPAGETAGDTTCVGENNEGITRLHIRGLKPVGIRGGVVFGTALGVDSFLLGIPAGLSGFPPLVTACAAAGTSFIFVTVGSDWGRVLKHKLGSASDFLAAGLLIVLAVVRLIPG
jgi:putative Mn2+ efflux pump MntP